MCLIANMVIKNEADRYLLEVLDNLSNVVDKIVITDDSSTDDSVEIASRYTPYVNKLNESLFSVNEGQLRQKAWDYLSSVAIEGDWILCIDADEIISIEHIIRPLDKLLTQTRYDVIGIKFFHMWNEHQFRYDKAWKPNVGSRLFRYRNNGVFSERKLACGSEPTYVQEMIRDRKFLIESGIHIKHLGYVKDEDKNMKYKRYMKLDHGDYHSLAHIESIIDEEPSLHSWRNR